MKTNPKHFGLPIGIVILGLVVSAVSYNWVEQGKTIRYQGGSVPATSGIACGVLIILIGIYGTFKAFSEAQKGKD